MVQFVCGESVLKDKNLVLSICIIRFLVEDPAQLKNILSFTIYTMQSERTSCINTIWIFFYIEGTSCKSKQEAHGPHRSPEKIVQINKHI